MKRWNGWGDEATHFPLPPSALHYLAGLLGEGAPAPDAELADVVAGVPASRLAPHPLILTDPHERLRHARGQSLPDWIALRAGRIGVFPDGVTYPASAEGVRALLDFARVTGTRLIPYGGGTSVVGHVNPLAGDAPVLTVDVSRLNRLVELDETSRLATLEAGVSGPQLEAQLRGRGYTLGHFPQSFEFSTLGGWIATRSTGHQSYHYGRIEVLFAGGNVETLLGPLELRALPASAAGPDLRQFFLGSEGRLGVITSAVVRVRPAPEAESFYGAFFHNWEAGMRAVRVMAQSRVGVSMLRLSDALESETTMRLAGNERLVAWAERGLRIAGFGSTRCLLVFGVTGTRVETGRAYHDVNEITRAHGGMIVGAAIGQRWQKSRFLMAYLRNSLWERGYAVDTFETALPWTTVPATAEDLRTTLHNGLADIGERVLAFSHLSHVYADGASLYTTCLYRRAADPGETLQRWQVLKTAASRAVVRHGGTISHQHGVGVDHAPYLEAEKGAVGMKLLEAARQALDPDGLLNPGKLLMDGQHT
jgi:alkyldihydroxyacetonephosphate synthase